MELFFIVLLAMLIVTFVLTLQFMEQLHAGSKRKIHQLKLLASTSFGISMLLVFLFVASYL